MKAMLIPAVIVLTVLATLPGAGIAADWTVRDLGRLHKDHHCMRAAVQSFRKMLGEAEIDLIRHSDWVAYADGINGQHDAVITCTYGDNRGTRATLVIHSRGRPIDGHLLARRIEQVFEGQAQQITQSWKDSFN